MSRKSIKEWSVEIPVGAPRLVAIIGSDKSRQAIGEFICPICKEHYTTRISSVIKGSSSKCFSCGRSAATVKRAKSLEEWRLLLPNCAPKLLALVPRVHKDKATRGIFVCPECNKEYETNITSVKDGVSTRCKKCVDVSFKAQITSTNPTIIYYVHIKDYNVWKVGCTGISTLSRFKKYKGEVEILWEMQFDTGIEAYAYEKVLLKLVKPFKYLGDKILVEGGNTELFTKPLEHILLGI